MLQVDPFHLQDDPEDDGDDDLDEDDDNGYDEDDDDGDEEEDPETWQVGHVAAFR